MTDESSDWKPLPVAAVAALYVNGIQRFVRENLVAFFGAGTGFAISESLGWREFGLVGALVLLAGLLAALIYHRRFRYRFDADAVRVRKGLLEQQEIKVRFERIQNVGFSQPLYLKPLGLVRVTLETPGAAQTEVNLPGISLAEAIDLRDRVSGHPAAPPVDSGGELPDSVSDAQEGGDAQTVGFEASASDLFRYGMTSNQVWILLALVGAPASNWVESRMTDWIERLRASGILDMDALQGAPLLVAALVGLAVLAAALIFMTVSGLLAILRYGGYRLIVESGRFKSRFGLLDVREKTLRAVKLHSIECVQTAAGRLLDQWHVIGHQTGGAQPGGQHAEDRRFLVPGVDSRRICGVVNMLRGASWRVPGWNGIHRRFRSMLWGRIGVATAIAALVAWWFVPGTATWLLGIFAGLVLFVFLSIHLAWRRWGYALDGRRIRIRRGLIGQRVMEFDMMRCQQIGLRTSPYQRRHGLATVAIRLPHGEQRIPYIERSVAERIVDLVLYRVETSRMHGL